MDIVEEAYTKLFPASSYIYTSEMAYSGKFKGYNASVRKSYSHLRFSLSGKWKGVDREIQIGLIQHLLLRILHAKGKSLNIDLYNNFIKSLHISTPKLDVDPKLMDSYARVVALMGTTDFELPNLVWGRSTFHKLASYSYEADTITVSSLFKDAPEELLDYLMWHELLHKKFKFSSKGGRTTHHSPEFLRWERRFPNSPRIEKELGAWVRTKKRVGIRWLPF